jgi:hypothetical protein
MNFIRLVRKKKFFWSLNNCFFCKAELLWVSWEQCGKNNFSELEKLFFCKASVLFKLLRKTMFQVPKPTHILILGRLWAVQARATNTFFFGAWKIVFLQSPVCG